MTTDLTPPHVDCDEVRRLVDAHIGEIERQFARRLVAALHALRPSTDHPADRAFAKGVDVAATTALVLAGLPADLKEANRV